MQKHRDIIMRAASRRFEIDLKRYFEAGGIASSDYVACLKLLIMIDALCSTNTPSDQLYEHRGDLSTYLNLALSDRKDWENSQ